MTENTINLSELNTDEKLQRLSKLSKAAIKSLQGSYGLDETEAMLKKNIAEASDEVNRLSKQLASGEQHNKDEYNAALNLLTKATRKLDKFLDNYEELRDGTGSKLTDLRSFIDELIKDITAEPTAIASEPVA